MATKKPEPLVDVDDDAQPAEPDEQIDTAGVEAETGRPEPLEARDGSPAAALWSLNTRWRHINHGSYGAVPLFAQLRRMAYLQEAEGAPQRWFMAAPARVAQARADLADFIGVDADSFGFVPNASAGMTASIRALQLGPGDAIAVTDHTYGAVAFSAKREARQRGAKVRTVPSDSMRQRTRCSPCSAKLSPRNGRALSLTPQAQ